MNNLAIIMPAYNEELNIHKVVEDWYPVIDCIEKSNLIIINDGSKDKTLNVLNSLSLKYPKLIVIDKPNSGHGPTCIFGYKYSIKNNYKYIFQTDSDGQTVSKEFSKFWEQKENYDFIIGVRNTREDGFSRVIITKILKVVLFMIFGVWIKDANTPFRLMNSQKLKRYIDVIPEDFFIANVLLTVFFVKNKEKVMWSKISFKKRNAGENSINIPKIIKIGIKSIKELIKLRKKITI